MRKSSVMRVNKKHLTPAFALLALWGRETERIQKFGKVSSIFICFLLCEGDGAQPRVAADICCSFLLRETQPGASSSPNSNGVLQTPWFPPAGRGCSCPRSRWLGSEVLGAGARGVGEQLFWIPLSACFTDRLFLS